MPFRADAHSATRLRRRGNSFWPWSVGQGLSETVPGSAANTSARSRPQIGSERMLWPPSTTSWASSSACASASQAWPTSLFSECRSHPLLRRAFRCGIAGFSARLTVPAGRFLHANPPCCAMGSSPHANRGNTDMTSPAPMIAGVTPQGSSVDGIVWHILGQTYTPLHVTESSFSWHALLLPGTFVPPHVHTRRRTNSSTYPKDASTSCWMARPRAHRPEI